MILLDTSTKLELVLGDAATTEMDWAVTYIDTTDDTSGQANGTSNDTTDVTLVDAPASGNRLIRYVNIYNSDDAAHDVTVKIDDTSNERMLVKYNLGVGKTLVYDSQSGWYEAFNVAESSGGDLLSTNNLSDVASVDTSRANLNLNPANTFTISPSGADYTTIQAALDDNVTAGTLFLVYPGTYTDDTIHFTANNQEVRAKGVSPARCLITTASSNILDYSTFTGCRVNRIKMSVTAATTLVHTVQGSTGSCALVKCHTSMTTTYATGGTQPSCIYGSGTCTIKVSEGTVEYNHTGSNAAIAKALLNCGSSACNTEFELANINITGANSSFIIGITFGTGATVLQINKCVIAISDPDATIIAGIYIGNTSSPGGATDGEFTGNSLHVTGGGTTAAGLYINSATADIRGMHNHIHVEGSTTNYSYVMADLAAQATSQIEDIIAADGTSIGASAVFKMVSSEVDGSLTLSGSLTADDDVISDVPSTAKTTMVDADVITLWDSAASWVRKKISGTNLKAYLLTYFAGIFSNPNILINSNFEVNQLAVTGSVVLGAGVYGHDGFYAGGAGCSYTFATSNGITTITISAGSLIQKVETTIPGAHTLSWTGTAEAELDGGGAAVSPITETLTGGANIVCEWDTGTVAKVNLVPGSVATKWTRDANCSVLSPFILERMERINAIDTYGRFGRGDASSTTEIIIIIEHARKRSGAWTLGSSGTFTLFDGVGLVAVTGITLIYRSDGKTACSVTVASGLTQGQSYSLMANNDPDAYLDFLNNL